MEISVEVGLQRAIEMFLGEILELVDVLLKGGVVDEDVELAEFLTPF